MSYEIPQVETSKKFHFFTSIWIVPLMALLIAGWLAYQYYAQLGPQIQIVFAKNEGLVASQSQIKYKDVPIGKVEKIELQEGGDGVVVFARIDKSASPYVNRESKFWIVKPEVGISGVSGLDTLLSGTYINMYTKVGAEPKDSFIGLDHAYRNVQGGEYFVLKSQKGESAVKVGTPIYLKNVKVGQVEYVVLSLDDASVDVIVFIEKGYLPFLSEHSKFWVRSSVDAGFHGGNFDLKVAPLTDLIQGAIEFSTTGIKSRRPLPDNFTFELYHSHNALQSTPLGKGGKWKKHFMLHADNNLALLKKGALVRYDSFEVGEVKEVLLGYNPDSHKIEGEVSLLLDLSVFEVENEQNRTGEYYFYQAIKEGLHAKIVSCNLLTGDKAIDLVFEPSEKKGEIVYKNGEPYVPFSTEPQRDVMALTTSILAKVNALPLDKVIDDFDALLKESNHSVAQADVLLRSLEKSVENLNRMTETEAFQKMPEEVNKSLKSLSHTLYVTRKVVKGYATKALFMKQLSDTLKIVTEASKEMKYFLEMLNRKPNSLIFGDH